MNLRREIFASVDAMLSPQAMSEILERKVASVTCYHSDTLFGFSGNQFYFVISDHERLVMKCLRPKSDWIAIATDDTLCRSVTLWQHDILNRLYPYFEHRILAVCHDGDGYAILMGDLTEDLLHERALTGAEIDTLLDALAAMHATFWGDGCLENPDLGLSTVEKLITFMFPTSVAPNSPHSQTMEHRRSHGWDILLSLLDPDVRDDVQSLIKNPQPLLDVLATYPSTLLHGDYRTNNLALTRNSAPIVAFDWQCAAYAPMTIDLAWFLMTSNVFSMSSSGSPTENVEILANQYYARLTTHRGRHLDPKRWQAMLEVGLLVDLLRKGCWHALNAVIGENEDRQAIMRMTIAAYNHFARQGMKWLC